MTHKEKTLNFDFRKNQFQTLFLSSFLGVSEMSINRWDEENAPCQLPDDYKAFL